MRRVWGSAQRPDDLRQKLADLKPDSVVNSFPDAVAAIISLTNLIEMPRPILHTEDLTVRKSA